ncbi:hypothetical protein [uncultured Maricaulis sp.]|uniref:hypothetical protein n=1 Tax=uncultured Maricaulis sp. TaxID=174710 RepID=UPI0030DCE071
MLVGLAMLAFSLGGDSCSATYRNVDADEVVLSMADGPNFWDDYGMPRPECQVPNLVVCQTGDFPLLLPINAGIYELEIGDQTYVIKWTGIADQSSSAWVSDRGILTIDVEDSTYIYEYGVEGGVISITYISHPGFGGGGMVNYLLHSGKYPC